MSIYLHGPPRSAAGGQDLSPPLKRRPFLWLWSFLFLLVVFSRERVIDGHRREWRVHTAAPTGRGASAHAASALARMRNAFPRILHQSWKTDAWDSLPPTFRTLANTWWHWHADMTEPQQRKFNQQPEKKLDELDADLLSRGARPPQEQDGGGFGKWTYSLWSDRANDWIVEKFYPTFWKTYAQYPKNIFKVDAARLAYLHRYGGVYADLDYEALSSFGPLLVELEQNYDVVVGSFFSERRLRDVESSNVCEDGFARYLYDAKDVHSAGYSSEPKFWRLWYEIKQWLRWLLASLLPGGDSWPIWWWFLSGRRWDQFDARSTGTGRCVVPPWLGGKPTFPPNQWSHAEEEGDRGDVTQGMEEGDRGDVTQGIRFMGGRTTFRTVLS